MRVDGTKISRLTGSTLCVCVHKRMRAQDTTHTVLTPVFISLWSPVPVDMVLVLYAKQQAGQMVEL